MFMRLRNEIRVTDPSPASIAPVGATTTPNRISRRSPFPIFRPKIVKGHYSNVFRCNRFVLEFLRLGTFWSFTCSTLGEFKFYGGCNQHEEGSYFAFHPRSGDFTWYAGVCRYGSSRSGSGPNPDHDEEAQEASS